MGVADIVDLLGDDLAPAPYLILVIVLAFWVWWYRHNKRIFLPDGGQLSGEAEQRRLNDLAARRQWIAERHFETIYLDLLGRMLDEVATRLTRDKDQLEKNQKQKGWVLNLFGVNPFTEGSYSFSLNLAIIYPWLAFFIIWLVGGTGEFFNLQLLHNESLIFGRFGALFCSVLLIWVWWKAFGNTGNNWWRILFWIVLIFSMAISPIVTTFSAAIALPIFALFIAYFAKGPEDSISSFHIAISVALAIAFGAILFFYFENAYYFIGVFFILILLFIAVAWLIYLCKTSQMRTLYWITFNFLYLLASTYLISKALGDNILDEYILILVFLIILPLINAFVDWLSLGFTRGFLYAIRQRVHNGWKALGFVVFDILLALIFLLAITSLTVLLLGVSIRLPCIGTGSRSWICKCYLTVWRRIRSHWIMAGSIS